MSLSLCLRRPSFTQPSLESHFIHLSILLRNLFVSFLSWMVENALSTRMVLTKVKACIIIIVTIWCIVRVKMSQKQLYISHGRRIRTVETVSRRYQRLFYTFINTVELWIYNVEFLSRIILQLFFFVEMRYFYPIKVNFFCVNKTKSVRKVDKIVNKRIQN